MKARTFLNLTSLALALTLAAPVYAITVCYDYVYFRITNRDDRQRLGLGDVLQEMRVKGYKELTGQEKPGLDGTQLVAGDVIVMPGHIGYANGPNSIDHYIQCIPINSTSLVGSNDVTAHPQGQLPTLILGKTCRLGGFFANATLRDFLETTARPSRSKPRAEAVSYQVWRALARNWNWTCCGDNENLYSGTIEIKSENGKHGTFHGAGGGSIENLTFTGNQVKFDRTGIAHLCMADQSSDKTKQTWTGILSGNTIKGSWTGCNDKYIANKTKFTMTLKSP
jgi:hypothetical protein